MSHKYTLHLIIGLFLLRIPFIMGMNFLFLTPPLWVMLTYEIGTYLLISILLILEKENLSLFNIDKLSIIFILLFGSILRTSLLVESPVYSGLFFVSFFIISIILFLKLRQYFTLIKTPPDVVRWVRIAVIFTIGINTFFAFLVYLTASEDLIWFSNIFVLLISVPLVFVDQFSHAVMLEEPLYRGFFWGYLRSIGWKDKKIWIAVSGLFWISHLSTITNLYSLLVITPIISLLLGYFVLRSRSILPSMVAHAVYNAMVLGIF